MAHDTGTEGIAGRVVVPGVTGPATTPLLAALGPMSVPDHSRPRPRVAAGPHLFPNSATTPLGRALETPLAALPAMPIDALIIGSGTAGVSAGLKLVSHGLAVVILEAGPLAMLTHAFTSALRTNAAARQQLLDALQYDVTWTGAAPRDNYLVAAVGGRSLFWNGWIPRFAQADFAPWPVTYAEMRPYYGEAERLLRGGRGPTAPWVPYSTNAFQDEAAATLRAHGLPAMHPPLAVDTTAVRNGNFSLGLDSAVGRLVAHPLLRSGARRPSLTLVTNALATRLLCAPGQDRVRAVVVVDRETHREYEIAARSVVLAAGALQSTHLAMRSNVPDHGWLGGGIADHVYVKAEFPLPPHMLPPTPATLAVLIPASAERRFQLQVQAPTGDLYGWDAAQSWPPTPAACTVDIRGFGVPTVAQTNRLVLADEAGLDAARDGWAAFEIVYQPSSDDEQLTAEMRATIEHVRQALGAGEAPLTVRPPGTARHELGGMRMATERQHGVTDPVGRVFGLRNLVVADASSWPSQSAANPYLTITANALRVATALAATLQ